MKKLLGMAAALLAVAILAATFMATQSSAAGEKARDGRFIAYDNGTVLDTKTNLMWANKDNGATIQWGEAKVYCENFRGGGYTDWRMPTLDELTELYDETKSFESDCGDGKILHLTELIRIRCGWVWSSDLTGLAEAYNFLFYDGTDHRTARTGLSYSVRALPVRDTK